MNSRDDDEDVLLLAAKEELHLHQELQGLQVCPAHLKHQ
jgi:hypothetical protein